MPATENSPLPQGFRRWVISSADGAVTWTMPKNPRTMSSPNLTHSSTTTPVGIDGRRRALRGPDQLREWTFEGRTRDFGMYAELLALSTYDGLLRITDHLGRVHEVYPKAFLPSSVDRQGTPNPWLYDYVFKCLYVRRIA